MTGSTSLVLWLMAAVVVVLAGYLFVGWVRRSQLATGLRAALGPVLLGGAALGLAMSGSIVLAIASESLAFPLGYRWLWLPALLAGPVVAAWLAAMWLSRQQGWLALLGCGLLLGAAALAVQVGWVTAAGFRPGVRWQWPLLGAAGFVAVAGFVAALWLAYSDASSSGGRKSLWRAGAAVLIMLTVVAGQEIVLASAALLSQVGSVYQREAGGTWLALGFGALLPVVLSVLALDLGLRNRADRQRVRGHVHLSMPQRRKRRRKYRAL